MIYLIYGEKKNKTVVLISMERALAPFQTAWEKEVLSSSYTFWEQDYKNLCYVWIPFKARGIKLFSCTHTIVVLHLQFMMQV